MLPSQRLTIRNKLMANADFLEAAKVVKLEGLDDEALMMLYLAEAVAKVDAEDGAGFEMPPYYPDYDFSLRG